MSQPPALSDAAVLRPTVVEVSLARLAENFRAIQAAVAPAAVMPIVKANAYGHGIVEVARHLVTLGAASLGVAFLEEAVMLREVGIHLPILVMGGIWLFLFAMYRIDQKWLGIRRGFQRWLNRWQEWHSKKSLSIPYLAIRASGDEASVGRT